MPRIPGTHVTINPPVGFAPAAGFAGFARPDREAAIAVTELPTPRGVLVRDLSRDALAAKGAQVVVAEARGDAWWVRLHEVPWTGPVERWMVALGDDRRTALVIATAPSGDAELEDQIEAALATATFDAASSTSPFEGLRFRVVEQGGLSLAARSHGLVVLTPGGVVGQPKGAPMLTVGTYEAPGLPADWYAFATGHLKDLAQLSDVGDIRGTPLELPSGALAYELRADGLSVPDGSPMAIYLLGAATDGLRAVVSGVVAFEAAEVWLPIFRDIGRSLVLEPEAR